jgi:hypothetical protein
MVAVHLHTDYSAASSGKKLEGDAASAREEIEGCSSFKVDILIQHVEDVLLGEVSGRSRLECARNVEMAALVYSCDDTHGVISPW